MRKMTVFLAMIAVAMMVCGCQQVRRLQQTVQNEKELSTAYEFTGTTEDSSPLQLQDQISISAIESAGKFEDVDEALLDANTLEGVGMMLLDVTPTSARLSILNATDLDIRYGSDYNLQFFDQDDWHDVPYLIDNAAFTAEAYMALKDHPSEWDVNWEVFHGTLEPGKYRIVKPVMDFRGTGDYTEYYLDAEFTILEE